MFQNKADQADHRRSAAIHRSCQVSENPLARPGASDWAVGFVRVITAIGSVLQVKKRDP